MLAINTQIIRWTFKGLDYNDQQVMIGFYNKDKVFNGWQILSKCTNIMPKNLIIVYTKYGSRIKTYLHGAIFVILSIGANNQIIFLTMAN